MSDVAVKDILKTLEGSICGMFATPLTLDSATEYAKELIGASAPEQMEMSVLIALGNYHNAMVYQIKCMVEDVVLLSGLDAANE